MIGYDVFSVVAVVFGVAAAAAAAAVVVATGVAGSDAVLDLAVNAARGV